MSSAISQMLAVIVNAAKQFYIQEDRWTSRCGDMLTQLRRNWEEERAKNTMSKFLLSEWDTPNPRVCASTVCTWTRSGWSPPGALKPTATSSSTTVTIARMYLQATYYSSEGLLLLKLACMHAACLGNCTAKIQGSGEVEMVREWKRCLIALSFAIKLPQHWAAVFSCIGWRFTRRPS